MVLPLCACTGTFCPPSAHSAWTSLDGWRVLTSNVAVDCNANRRLEVFVRGTDSALWYLW